MKTSIKYASLAALIVPIFGFFIAWIGGVKPFTFWAGLTALFTIIGMIVAFCLTFSALENKGI